MVELLALLVQAPFHLPEIRPQVGFGPLQLANQALQLSLREIVPVQREGIGQWLEFLILNLDLYLRMRSNIRILLLPFFIYVGLLSIILFINIHLHLHHASKRLTGFPFTKIDNFSADKMKTIQ